MGRKHLTSLGAKLRDIGKFDPPVHAIPPSISPTLGLITVRAAVVGMGIRVLLGGGRA